MRKNPLHIALLLLLVRISVEAQTLVPTRERTPGNSLYVFTLSGLMLRDKPDPKGAPIQVIPYGGTVVVQPDPGKPIDFSVASIAGKWVKLKFGAKEGYAFDGFLSRFNPGGISQGKLIDYVKKVNKVKTSDTTPKDATTSEYEETVFVNGADYEFIRSDGGTFSTITFPNAAADMHELLLLAKVFLPIYFETTSTCKFNVADIYCTTEKSSLFIEKKAARVVIREVVPSF